MEITAAKKNADCLEHSHCRILSCLCVPRKYFISDKIASIMSNKWLYEMSLMYWEWGIIGSRIKELSPACGLGQAWLDPGLHLRAIFKEIRGVVICFLLESFHNGNSSSFTKWTFSQIHLVPMEMFIC